MANPLSAIWQPSITTEAPTAREIQRNDLALFVTVLLLLLAGWLVRMTVQDQAQTQVLAADLPTILYPSDWVTTGTTDDLLFAARNPASPSTLDSEIRVQALPVREGESLETLRVIMSLRRNQELDRYRELTAERVLVGGAEPGYLVSYAYVADPTSESGIAGLPVVAEGQDLLFGSGNQWLVISTVADAAEWEDARAPFDDLFKHLQVQPAVLQEEIPQTTGATPAATEGAAP
jgi:hypothetical protein